MICKIAIYLSSHQSETTETSHTIPHLGRFSNPLSQFHNSNFSVYSPKFHSLTHTLCPESHICTFNYMKLDTFHTLEHP